MNKRTVAIIQARMGSTRFPGKILKNIQGKPLLWHIANRLRTVIEIDEIVIATSRMGRDDQVYSMAEQNGILCFRGSESDVLNRYFSAAIFSKADHVMRITGDCPVVDPGTIKKLIDQYFEGGYDFCGVACGAGVANEEGICRYPDGLDAEIFSFKVLSEANIEAQTNMHREHVTPFIWQNNERYKLASLYSESDHSDLRLTVDTREDFDFINWIYDRLYPSDSYFNLKNILDLIQKYPEIMQNRHLIGQEGYEEFWN
jgi:spore coat polysaccharide biosynthesis protein SpsF